LQWVKTHRGEAVRLHASTTPSRCRCHCSAFLNCTITVFILVLVFIVFVVTPPSTPIIKVATTPRLALKARVLLLLTV
jgi:hypothetical protein